MPMVWDEKNEAGTDTATDGETVVEYEFEGFEVEFSEKVALLPISKPTT